MTQVIMAAWFFVVLKFIFKEFCAKFLKSLGSSV
jgi:hypothetical protein